MNHIDRIADIIETYEEATGFTLNADQKKWIKFGYTYAIMDVATTEINQELSNKEV
jgi:hypothetical protein